MHRISRRKAHADQRFSTFENGGSKRHYIFRIGQKDIYLPTAIQISRAIAFAESSCGCHL